MPGRAMIIWLAVAITVFRLTTTHFEPHHSDAVLKGAIVVGIVAWAWAYVGLSWKQLALDPPDLKRGVLFGVITAAVVALGIALAVVLVAVFPHLRSHFPTGTVPKDSPRDHVLQPLLFIPFGTVVFEETIFRVVLLTVLERIVSPQSALGWSSVAFGLWHVPPAIWDQHHWGAGAVFYVLGTFVVTAVAGVLFGALRQRSQSAMAPALAHWATDGFAYVGALIVLHL